MCAHTFICIFVKKTCFCFIEKRLNHAICNKLFMAQIPKQNNIRPGLIQVKTTKKQPWGRAINIESHLNEDL